MDYDAETQKWSVTVTLGDGEMKFRWDAAWTINFGGSLGALTQDGGNIKDFSWNIHDCIGSRS